MKIKLTPQFSYIIGITKYSGLRNGIGVKGGETLQRAFAQGAIEAGIAVPHKLIVKGSSIRMFHSAYKAYFTRIQKEAMDKYIHNNDYAAAYLAGIFDAVGGRDEKKVYLQKCDFVDDAVFEKLGYGIRKNGDQLLVMHPEQFLKFISKFRKVDDIELGRRNRRTPTS